MEYVLKSNLLSKSYGKFTVVNNVSMNVKKGDIYGFIGKNGAGKTTFMKMICGLAKPTHGEFELFGSTDLQKGRRRIGCVIEQPALYPDMTARQNLSYYNMILGITDNSNIDAVLEQVGLGDTGKKKTKQFSLGMKQRLSIAISLLGNPDFLVLDEPINGLDPAGIKEVRELLLKLNQENNITIVISSHILGELTKLATKYGIIDNGTLVDEFEADELEERCKSCLKITVNDVDKAAFVLRDKFNSSDFKAVGDNMICIYDVIDKAGEINTELVNSGLIVSGLHHSNGDAESYFIKMMGGM